MTAVTFNRNVEVAKRLGYHIYHYDKDVAERCYYQLWKPDGMEVGTYPDNEHKTEAEAWGDAPKWDSDLYLALELIEQANVPASISTVDGRYWSLAINGSTSIQNSLTYLPVAVVDWWLANVDVKKLNRQREIAARRQQIAFLQDEIAELEAGDAD